MSKIDSNKNPKLEQALHYAEKFEWSIIPVRANKKPLLASWKKYQKERASRDQIIGWFKQFPDANIAVVTGQISNLLIVDIDPRHGGSYEKFKDIETVKSKTGGNGYHIFFRYEEGVKNQAGTVPGIDVRGEAGYAVLPGSTHASGKIYKWITHPDKVAIVPLPDFVKALLQKPKRKNKNSNWDKDILNGVEVGRRNTSAASVAGKLLKRFPEEEWEDEAWPLLKAWNQKNKEPLPEEELRAVFESIKQKQSENSDDTDEKSKSVALQIVEEIKKEKIIFFHTSYKEGYAAIKGDGREVLKLRSKSFKQFIAYHVYKNFGRFISSDTINNVIQLLEGKAIFDGEQYDLHTRIANYGDAIWYDLGDGSAVHLDKSGWRVSATPPILFKRFPHQLEQVAPVAGDDIIVLWNFINLHDEGEKLLFLVYTVACFIPDFPHPLLVFYGPQGAGKTTPLRLLKSLIDPSALKTLSAPDGIREFVQLASHHYFFFLDNISSLPDWLSDALARACTGDGFTKRELFSDDDDVIYSFQRSVGLNGINLVVQKADLLDRSILIGLERISKDSRREEQEFWKEFDKLKPQILGAVFDVVVLALIEYPNISLESHPRMADFARWGCAIARALGYEDKDFLDAYNRNIVSQNEAAIEASPVGTTIVTLMEDQEVWEGTPTQLLTDLEKLAESLKVNVKARDWPKDPSWLTRRIQLIHSNLADQGIKVTRDDKSRPRRLILQKVSENPVAADNGDEASPDNTNSPTPSLPPSEVTDTDADSQTSLFSGPKTGATPTTPFTPVIGDDQGKEEEDESFPY